MNRYDFSYKGRFYVGCYTNDVAEMHIHGCAYLARRGEAPYYWHNPDTGKDVLQYTDSFRMWKECPGTNKATFRFEVTPSTLSWVCKAIREQLSAFDYVNGEWVYNGKVVK